MSKYPDYQVILKNRDNERVLSKDQIKHIESLSKKRPDMTISVQDICPNDWNKNQMGKGFQVALEEVIANVKIGQTTPILVADNYHENTAGKEKYVIVDGYHRWLAHVSLGIGKIRAVYLKDVSIDEAKLITLINNRIRGQTPDISVHDSIKDINLGNVDFNIHTSLNIEPINIDRYDFVPPTTEPTIPSHPSEQVPQSESTNLQNGIQTMESQNKQELQSTMPEPEVRTTPVTLFMSHKEKEIFMEHTEKIMSQEKFKGERARERALVHAVTICSDITKREKVISIDDARQEREMENERKKAEKKQEKDRKKAEKDKYNNQVIELAKKYGLKQKEMKELLKSGKPKDIDQVRELFEQAAFFGKEK